MQSSGRDRSRVVVVHIGPFKLFTVTIGRLLVLCCTLARKTQAARLVLILLAGGSSGTVAVLVLVQSYHLEYYHAPYQTYQYQPSTLLL